MRTACRARMSDVLRTAQGKRNIQAVHVVSSRAAAVETRPTGQITE